MRAHHTACKGSAGLHGCMAACRVVVFVDVPLFEIRMLEKWTPSMPPEISEPIVSPWLPSQVTLFTRIFFEGNLEQTAMGAVYRSVLSEKAAGGRWRHVLNAPVVQRAHRQHSRLRTTASARSPRTWSHTATGLRR